MLQHTKHSGQLCASNIVEETHMSVKVWCPQTFSYLVYKQSQINSNSKFQEFKSYILNTELGFIQVNIPKH